MALAPALTREAMDTTCSGTGGLGILSVDVTTGVVTTGTAAAGARSPWVIVKVCRKFSAAQSIFLLYSV